MEYEGCGMFECARTREEWDAESAGAYLCGTCLTRRMARKNNFFLMVVWKNVRKLRGRVKECEIEE